MWQALFTLLLLNGCAGIDPSQGRMELEKAQGEHYASLKAALQDRVVDYRMLGDAPQTVALTKKSPTVPLEGQARAAFALVEVPLKAKGLAAESEGRFYGKESLSLVLPRVYYLRGGKLQELVPEKQSHSSSFSSCATSSARYRLDKLRPRERVLLVLASVPGDKTSLGVLSPKNVFFKGSEIRPGCLSGPTIQVHANYLGNINLLLTGVGGR
jgi:hypothetical protein